MKYRENFINYSVDLINNNNVVVVYKKLYSFFKKTKFYTEAAGILEKIYMINNDFKLYKTIGDIYLHKIGDYHYAKIAYNEFLKNKDYDFYRNYTTACEIQKNDDDSYTETENVAALISNRFIAICYMIRYCCENQNFKCILDLKQYLLMIKEELFNFMAENNLELEECLDEFKLVTAVISRKLAQAKHSQDIDELAIELDPKNEEAYINIIDKFIEYKNYDLALNFYNDKYAVSFDTEQKTLIDLYWFLADKHRQFNDPYRALKRQQDVIYMELGE